MAIEIIKNSRNPHVENVKKSVNIKYYDPPENTYAVGVSCDPAHKTVPVGEWREGYEKYKERLAYNAAYQRDLRTIKRLGLSVTVAEWRKQNEIV